ncbi:tetraacyldisaccharide 4'-kinase [Alphaproteobacteria bacterium]|nr:tetraacyldisaccharide 4'-kinase [Alphaproteobacteria bacterium]
MIKTPGFWYRSGGAESIQEKLLSPFSKLYGMVAGAHRNSKTPRSTGVPVVCIGNLNAGGSGKTPMALVLMQMIKDQNLAKSPFFLSRGYGGKIMGPTLFAPKRHDFKDVGDEVMLLGHFAPTIVSRDRFVGAKLGAERGAGLVIMDDGLQNYDLQQDLKIVVVDGAMGFGNGKVIPAGPLREDLESGLAKADLFVVMGEDQRGLDSILSGTGKPVLKAQLRSQVSNIDPDQTFFAFAGLGWPEKFFGALRKAEVTVVGSQGFADHHPYTPEDMNKLVRKAEGLGAKLITTRKDFVRIPGHYKTNDKIAVAGVQVIWDDPSLASSVLHDAIARIRKIE